LKVPDVTAVAQPLLIRTAEEQLEEELLALLKAGKYVEAVERRRAVKHEDARDARYAIAVLTRKHGLKREEKPEGEAAAKPSIGSPTRFRMKVDYVFPRPDKGIQVNGQIDRGVVRVGDKLILEKKDGEELPTECFEIAQPEKNLAVAHAGERVGLGLLDLGVTQVTPKEDFVCSLEPKRDAESNRLEKKRDVESSRLEKTLDDILREVSSVGCRGSKRMAKFVTFVSWILAPGIVFVLWFAYGFHWWSALLCGLDVLISGLIVGVGDIPVRDDQTSTEIVGVVVASALLVLAPGVFLFLWLACDFYWWSAFLWGLAQPFIFSIIASVYENRVEQAMEFEASRLFEQQFPAATRERERVVEVLTARMEERARKIDEAILQNKDESPLGGAVAKEYNLLTKLVHRGTIPAEVSQRVQQIYNEAMNKWVIHRAKLKREKQEKLQRDKQEKLEREKLERDKQAQLERDKQERLKSDEQKEKQPPALKAQPQNARAEEQIIGGCRIERLLGRGGFASVYRAHHLGFDMPVALKILAADLAANEKDATERFLGEARVAARLKHPNIVGVLNVGQDQGVYFIVMELIEGGDLRQLLKKETRLPLQQAVQVARHVCSALQLAHENGIIHRDIKPANILIEKDGTAKLADLGLAKRPQADFSLTQTGVAMGTPHYMAPEQIEDAKRADCRSDIYALGCTLYEMVCGIVPYNGSSIIQILRAHETAPIPDPRDTNPKVPSELAKTIMKMLAKAPKDRHQTAREVFEELEKLERLPV